MRARRTHRTFWLVLLAVLAAIVGLNLGVDPYGMVHQVSLTAKGPLRLCGQPVRRGIKAVQIAKGGWDGLALGSSRIEWGFDPDLPAIGEMRFYNGGMPVMTAVELEAMLGYAHASTKPQLIIIDMDPITFARGGSDKGLKDFAESPLAGKPAFSLIAAYAFNYRSSLEALRWLFMPLREHKDVCKLNGARYMGMRNVRVDHRQNFDKILAKSLRKATFEARFSNIEDAERRMSSLIGKLTRVAKDGVHIYLFLPPVHVAVHEHIARLGWEANLRRYRRALVAAVEAANVKVETPPRKASATKIRLWDFSGYNAMTTEPVPGLQSAVGAKMLWYYDPFHITPRAMQVLYCRMRDGMPLACQNTELPTFGREVSSSNIGAHEEEETSARSAYLATHPELTAYMNERAEEASKSDEIDVGPESE